MKLMNLPQQWQEWGLLSETFWREQFNVVLDENVHLFESDVETLDCRDSEHYRFGLFIYWLAKNPEPAILDQLEQLAQLDPDPLMASQAQQLIRNACSQAK